jgi:8-oxo-dGTP pyrophosphatase MutT (NUDIX family)
LDQPLTDTGFQRHVRACTNADLPGKRIPFLIGDQQVGWITDRIASTLAGIPAINLEAGRVTLTDPAALPGIARGLSERGLYRWRREAFDVRATPDGPALTQIDRGAIPSFGIQAAGVHVNGLLQRQDGLHLWIARRAMNKQLDPGKLDHIVAGGVPAGLGPAETLVKEAAEEAAIPADLASKAVHVGTIGYAMERPEGLRRDCLYCYDLMLSEEFTPEAADGEVEAFELWPIKRAFEAVRDTRDFKFNVNLVLIDLFIRQGLIEGTEADTLRTQLHRLPCS